MGPHSLPFFVEEGEAPLARPDHQSSGKEGFSIANGRLMMVSEHSGAAINLRFVCSSRRKGRSGIQSHTPSQKGERKGRWKG